MRVCLFGAPLDTGNRGVEALGMSVLAAAARRGPGTTVTVFDNGWGTRPGPALPGLTVDLVGVRRSRRVHRRESWANVRLSQRLRVPGSPVARRLHETDVVLDLSGGDSFTDIYGPRRLQSVLEPKDAARRAGRPLVLLPQTYGPFRTPAARARAAAVLRGAEQVWARDADSYEVLAHLLAADLDPGRHRLGVDVAFALRAQAPDEQMRDQVSAALRRDHDDAVVGVNVSGLLWDRRAAQAFGLALDHDVVVTDLVRGLVQRGCRVVLVPHVRDVAHQAESDLRAAQALLQRLSREEATRVVLAPDTLNASEAKWLIGQLDWFCGSRMHSTIAALSSGVPAAALAYSMKTRGVFATCGVRDEVVEARHTDTRSALSRLLDAFDRRAAVRSTLRRDVPRVVAQAEDQLEEAFEVGSPNARRGAA